MHTYMHTYLQTYIHIYIHEYKHTWPVECIKKFTRLGYYFLTNGISSSFSESIQVTTDTTEIDTASRNTSTEFTSSASSMTTTPAKPKKPSVNILGKEVLLCKFDYVCDFGYDCHWPAHKYSPACRCNTECMETGTCCFDYEARCVRNESLPTYSDILYYGKTFQNGYHNADIKGKSFYVINRHPINHE